MKNKFLLIFAAIYSIACTKTDDGTVSVSSQSVVLTTSVSGFENEEGTKVNTEGTGFLNGDRIRIKMICPFTSEFQNGESLDDMLHDGMWLQKYKNGLWTNLTVDDGCDINGDFIPSKSPSLSSLYLAQNTTYVFTASTWSEEISFVESGASGKVIVANITFNNVFHANQSIEEFYRSSDVLWAQQIMQTGTPYLHLEFKHVMSAVEITVQDDKGILTSDAVMTIEGMPEIDQQEIVVGDYYAIKSKKNEHYGYREKCSCTKENNGRVLGISTIDQTLQRAGVKGFGSIPCNETYTGFRISENKWRVIVPPVSISGDVVVWLRCGTERYSMTLTEKNFEQGKLYPIKMIVE